MGRSWPGNVRELRNFVERSVSLGLIERGRGELPAARGSRPPQALPSLEGMVAMRLPLKEARAAWIESFESIYVRDVLRQCGGNVTRAAERAGVSRRPCRA